MQASLGQWYFRRIAIPQLLPLYCLSNNRKKMVDLQLFRNQIYLQERTSNLLCLLSLFQAQKISFNIIRKLVELWGKCFFQSIFIINRTIIHNE